MPLITLVTVSVVVVVVVVVIVVVVIVVVVVVVNSIPLFLRMFDASYRAKLFVIQFFSSVNLLFEAVIFNIQYSYI